MAKQTLNQGRRWYVIHTYSGYEDQVADSLRQRIQSFHMQEFIFDVIVPIEKQIEIKNGIKELDGRQQSHRHSHHAKNDRRDNERLYNLVVVTDSF